MAMKNLNFEEHLPSHPIEKKSQDYVFYKDAQIKERTEHLQVVYWKNQKFYFCFINFSLNLFINFISYLECVHR